MPPPSPPLVFWTCMDKLVIPEAGLPFSQEQHSKPLWQRWHNLFWSFQSTNDYIMNNIVCHSKNTPFTLGVQPLLGGISSALTIRRCTEVQYNIFGTKERFGIFAITHDHCYCLPFCCVTAILWNFEFAVFQHLYVASTKGLRENVRVQEFSTPPFITRIVLNAGHCLCNQNGYFYIHWWLNVKFSSQGYNNCVVCVVYTLTHKAASNPANFGTSQSVLITSWGALGS